MVKRHTGAAPIFGSIRSPRAFIGARSRVYEIGLKGSAMRFSTPAVRQCGTLSAGIMGDLNHDVDTLLAALEEISLGVVLLDCDLRVKFVNSAFLRLYRLPDKSVVSSVILKVSCGSSSGGGVF
jgi:hypothetical protein